MTTLAVLLFATIIIFVPGCIACCRWFRGPLLAVTAAPALSVFLYCTVGVVASQLHIAVGPGSIFLISTLIALFIGGFSFYFQPKWSDDLNELVQIAVYVIVGLAFFYFVINRISYSWDSIIQSEDNVRHYAFIRSLLNSTDWSTLHVSMYGIGTGAVDPNSGACGSFYPIGWHVLSALTISLSGATLPLGSNAVLCIFICVVFPLGSLSLFKTLFPNEDRIHLLMGSVIVLSSTAAPWVLFCIWPLLPNMVSVCLMPSVLVLFIRLCDKLDRKTRVIFVIGFLAASAGICFVQPNGVFSCAVFLAPLVVSKMAPFVCQKCSAGETEDGQRFRFVVPLISMLFILLWVVMSRLPFLHGIVSYYWAPISSVTQAIADFLLCAYPIRFAQPLFALLVLAGAIRAFSKPGTVWITATYLVSGMLYVVSASFGDNILKHALTGFWYTDPYRLAAVAGVCSLPLAYLGFTYFFDKIVDAVTNGVSTVKIGRGFLAGLMVAISLAVFLSLPFEVRGLFAVDTPFSEVRNCLAGFTDSSEGTIVSKRKRAFLEKVNDIVGPDALIANNPFDGSCYAYALGNLNLMYRNDNNYDAAGSSRLSLIRSGLNRLAVDVDVSRLVDGCGVEYVLILEGDDSVMNSWYPFYNPSLWKGINAIDDNTDGFTLLLSDGSMSLYRIDR